MTREAASRVAVVGGSLAGLRAAEGLRKGGFEGEIVMFDAEDHLPYNRPPLSKGTYQSDELTASALALRVPRSLEGATWRLGTTVVGSDLESQKLSLSDGTTMSYDGLICATGLDVRRLPGEGGHLRHVIRTVEDAQRLFPAMSEHRSLLVIGAGFLGCEVTSVATEAGFAVTVVAPETVPMERPRSC